MSKQALKSPWEVHENGIRTVYKFKWRGELGGEMFETKQDIAFNIGRELAEHIVQLHNASLPAKNPLLSMIDLGKPLPPGEQHAKDKAQ